MAPSKISSCLSRQSDGFSKRAQCRYFISLVLLSLYLTHLFLWSHCYIRAFFSFPFSYFTLDHINAYFTVRTILLAFLRGLFLGLVALALISRCNSEL